MSYINYTRLMIGDILMATYDDGEKVTTFPVVVDGIDSNATLIDGSCYMSWHPLLPEHKDMEDVDEFNPIPLDCNILNKNKWKGTALYWSYKDVPFEVFINIGGGKPFINGHGKVCFDLRYVHQLQHALRLCGLNDMADNLKVI